MSRTVADIRESNKLNTYTVTCCGTQDELYKIMREDIRALIGHIVGLDLTINHLKHCSCCGKSLSGRCSQCKDDLGV